MLVELEVTRPPRPSEPPPPPTWKLVDGHTVWPSPLDALVREVWTQDVIDRRCRHARLIGQPGPPWAVYRAYGDLYWWYVFDPVSLDMEIPLEEWIDVQMSLALDSISEYGVLSTSQALEAGEQRRCKG